MKRKWTSRSNAHLENSRTLRLVIIVLAVAIIISLGQSATYHDRAEHGRSPYEVGYEV